MMLGIEPTARMVRINGVRCRVWDGIDEDGRAVLVYVAFLGIETGSDWRRYDADLQPAEMPDIVEEDD